MSKSIKAALLSALVFPGAGHFYLKRYLAGLLLTGATFAAIYFMISSTVQRAFEISDKILRSNAQLDIASITQAASQNSAGADTQLLNIATAAITICWLIAIIDSYRSGRLADNNDKNR